MHPFPKEKWETPPPRSHRLTPLFGATMNELGWKTFIVVYFAKMIHATARCDF